MVKKHQNNNVLWNMKLYEIQIFVTTNKVLLENSHAYSFKYCLRLSHDNGQVEFITVYGLQGLKYLLLSLYRKYTDPYCNPPHVPTYTSWSESWLFLKILHFLLLCTCMKCSPNHILSTLVSKLFSILLGIFQVVLPLRSFPALTQKEVASPFSLN